MIPMDAAHGVLVAGYKLDRYELLCPIASGGMATVWLAQLRGKRGFEKLFAIKTIRTEFLEDPRFQEMFLDEARIASGIQHPNVAQILDLGEQRDVLFIVMEWVDGDSLAKIRRLLAKRGAKLPVGIALRILADTCAGLHAAHELRDQRGEPLGIIHRDVSPQNILVAASGAVKVIDFGIAKAQNRKQGETRTGVVKGKIQYMAPEQVKKGTVDRRADIWSLGICLHELVAGNTPSEGDDDVEIIRKLLADEAPLPAEGLPEPVRRILESSMVLDPDARFPTAAGMQRALDAAMKELGETATSEDVAGVLRSELPELAEARRGVVNKAVEGLRERGTPPGAGSGEEVAFAPTMMSERSPRTSDDGRTIALTKRKEATLKPVPAPSTSGEDSRVRESSPPDQEPITIPKRSRAGLWTALLFFAAAAAAVYRWPGAAGRLLGVTTETRQTPRDAPTSSSVGGTLAAPVSSAASASSAPTATVASSAAAPPASSRRATPEPSTRLPPRSQAPLTPGSPPGAPTRTGAPPASASASAAAVPWYEPPAPTEDPNNPYGN